MKFRDDRRIQYTSPGLYLLLMNLLFGLTDQTVHAEPASLAQFYGPCTAEDKKEFNRLTEGNFGHPYLLVRQFFITAGWRPAPLQETSRWRKPSQPPYVPLGEEQVFIDKGYNELDSCAVDRDAPCVFLFRNKKGEALRVYTNGEEAPPSHAKVGFMMLACPPGTLP